MFCDDAARVYAKHEPAEYEPAHLRIRLAAFISRQGFTPTGSEIRWAFSCFQVNAGGILVSLEIVGRGIALGFSIAAPVGPIGLLVVRRSLVDGRCAGLATGLGAATADALYGAVAGLGLTAAGCSDWFRLAGGIFLLVLGSRAFRSLPNEESATSESRKTVASAYASALGLTLTNPVTLMSFAAFVASAGVGSAGGSAVAAFVCAVFAGSALWWILLSGGAALLRSRVTPRVFARINTVSGVMLAGFGLVAIASVLAARLV